MDFSNLRYITVNAITVVSFLTIALGVVLTFMGIAPAVEDSYSHPRTFIPLLTGVGVIFSGFFTLGFRYVVEAAVIYLMQKELDAEAEQEEE